MKTEKNGNGQQVENGSCQNGNCIAGSWMYNDDDIYYNVVEACAR